MKNKRKKNNLGVLLIAIVIILLGFFLVYILKNQGVNLENNLTKENNSMEENNLEFDEMEEMEYINNKIEEIKSSLGFIAILTSIDKYNAGGDYVTKKDKNLLEEYSTKQLFVMEQIITNKENYKNFVILNTSGEVDKEITDPTTEATIAYYPYNLFIREYNKYFKDTFQVKNRCRSNLNNTYDNLEEYVYYENRRSGLNGLSITDITITGISNLSSDKYQANITLHYSERLSNMLGVNSENAELVYSKGDDTIKIDSYLLK